MDKVLEKEYRKYKLYFYNEKYEELLKNIINKKYEVIKEFKNDNRTYVAKIRVNNKIFLLKKPFFKRKIKKYLSLFKKGESLESFLNIKKLQDKGIHELVSIYGAGVLRKGFIRKEFFLMEFFQGKICLEDKYYEKIVEVTKEIHSLGYYHGDCNPYNFLFDKNDNIKILDTKCKKMVFGNYKAHYDMLTIGKYFEGQFKYPYKMDIFYSIACLIKKLR